MMAMMITLMTDDCLLMMISIAAAGVALGGVSLRTFVRVFLAIVKQSVAERTTF